MKTYPFGFLFFVSFLLLAAKTKAQHSCGWMPPHLPLTQKQLAERQRFQAYLQTFQTTDADSLYTLPVVVHVIHTGGAVGSADNPNDAAIVAMLTNLNNAWRKNGSTYGGVDMKIQFQLATRSPGCGPTTGINRVNGSSVTGYASGGITNDNAAGSAPETAVKALSRWPNTDYINIWIVNKINGSSTAPGGYAYFPEYNSALTDGIVLQASVVDGTNKTIVHEMGHVFALYHTFYDGAYETTCAANAACSADGDMVCDTEPCLLQYDCSGPVNSCTSAAYAIADVPHNYTVLNNYMGYTNCQWMFTAGQKARVRAALFAYRYGLINSGGFTAPLSALPATACVPSATYGLSLYYGVQKVDFNTLHVYSNSSGADGGIYVDRTCGQSTTVIKGQTYTLTVTGSYENPHRITVFIDYNNDGDFDDAGETIVADYTGVSTTAVLIPSTGVILNTPLRMRVIADNPALPVPAACSLHGTSTEGAGQAEDFALIVVPRSIYSVASGGWNVASTWSCNCVPGGDDEVTIKAPHVVTVTPAMGGLQCGKLITETGSTFNVSSSLFKVIGK